MRDTPTRRDFLAAGAGVAALEACLALRERLSAGDLVFGAGSVLMGALTGTVGGKPQVTRTPGDQGLGTWENADVGTSGGFTDPLADHELFVHAKGAGVRGTKDEFHFAVAAAT